MSWWLSACGMGRHPAWTAVSTQTLPLAPLDPAGRGCPAQEDAGVEGCSTGGWRGPPPSSRPQAKGQGPTARPRAVCFLLSWWPAGPGSGVVAAPVRPRVSSCTYHSFICSPIHSFIPPHSELGERHSDIRGSSSPTPEQPERKGLPEAGQDAHIPNWLRHWASSPALDLASGQTTGWGRWGPARLDSRTLPATC